MDDDLSLIETERLIDELIRRHDRGLILLEKIGTSRTYAARRSFGNPREVLASIEIFKTVLITDFLGRRTMRAPDDGDDELNKGKPE